MCELSKVSVELRQAENAEDLYVDGSSHCVRQDLKESVVFFTTSTPETMRIPRGPDPFPAL